jgi:multidrug resistance efflux pump
MKRRVWIGLGAAIVAGGIATARFVGVATAQTVEVKAGPLHESIVATGEVVPTAGIANVYARTDGRVTHVYVREGDRVTAGQLLAEIDPAEAQAVVARLEAERRAFDASATAVSKGARQQERAAAIAALAAATASSRLADDHLARVEKLHASGSESDQAVFEARGQADIAHAQVEQARARRDQATAGGRAEDVQAARDHVAAADASLDEAKRRLDRTRVVAPVAGVVLARRVDEGDTVTAITPLGGAPTALFDVADPEKAEIALEVEETDALRLAEGIEVTITMPGGKDVLGKGHVTRLGARVQRRTIGADDARLRAETLVRSAWASYEGQLLPIGKRVEGVVHLPERVVSARVPRDAVRVKDGLAVVEVVKGAMVATQTVKLGGADDGYVEVQGLDVGARLVVKGGAR